MPAPAQALGQKDLVDPAALDRDPLVLVQVDRQPIQRPRREGQVQRLGIGERGGDHGGDLLGRIGRGPAAAGPILEAVEAFGVEAMDPAAHGMGVEKELLGDARHGLALAGAPDDAGALDPPGRGSSARMGQSFYRGALLVRQITQPQSSHGSPPASDEPRYSYLPDAPLSVVSLKFGAKWLGRYGGDHALPSTKRGSAERGGTG